MYSTILIDPPWRFEVWSRDTGLDRSAENHYPTMTIEALKALPIQSQMASDCAVFMWACWPTLPDALALGAAWGLEYKTCAFVWAKTTRKVAWRYSLLPIDDNDHWHMGMGYWTRANTEMCLLFTRGNPKRKSASVRQLLITPIAEHSRKPDEQYTRIEALVDGPYLEMFARRKREGWASWGNEVVSDIELGVVHE